MPKQILGTFLTLGLTLVLLLSGSPALSQKMYVVDELVITIRQSQSSSGMVVGRARSLDKVEILETRESWIKIRTGDGTVGWVLKKYLTETPPPGIRLKQIQEENKELLEKFGVLDEENQRLKALSADLEKRLAKEKEALSKLEEDYRDLGESAAEYAVLKKEYEKARDRLTQAKAESEKLKKAADETLNARRVKWFITGGVVLLVGWLVGMISARRKKASSQLY